MKYVPIQQLQTDIIKPGIDKFLIPLCLYRGCQSLGRIQQLWNFAIAMMHSEAESLSEGVKLSHNPDYSQLCGTHRPLNYQQIRAIFRRMRDRPEVTDAITGLTSYVRDIHPNECFLHRVPLEGERGDRIAPWRVFIRSRGKPININSQPRPEQLFYPYLVHDPKQEQAELLLLVHNAVPKNLPEQVRADLCQDLLVAIISGEISKDELKGSISEYRHRVFKMFPTKWGARSFDEAVPGHDDLTYGDLIGDDWSGAIEIMENA